VRSRGDVAPIIAAIYVSRVFIDSVKNRLFITKINRPANKEWNICVFVIPLKKFFLYNIKPIAVRKIPENVHLKPTRSNTGIELTPNLTARYVVLQIT
jgi:hypothetical protein